MKILLVVFLLVSANAEAGDKIGNGGGLWACRAPDRIVRAELVDLFEAREEFKLNLKAFGKKSADEILREQLVYVRSALPDLYDEWISHFNYALKNRQLVNAKLRPIEDSLYRIEPAAQTCPEGKWEYTQFANFTEYGQILIQRDLWESPAISELDRAALLFHESLYRWARIRLLDRDSVRARRIVGYLFSTLKPEELRREFDKAVPELTDGFPDESVDDRLGFFVSLGNPQMGVLHQADAPYGKNVSTGNFSSRCSISSSASGRAADLFCILEVEELDLYFNDLDLKVHVPSNMCSYLKESYYSFYGLEPGTGPERVEHKVFADGRIEDVLHTNFGVPQCSFDYSDLGGPNCCTGTYVHTVRTQNEDGTFTSSEVEKAWQGSPAQCLSGPATLLSTRDGQGFPLPPITYVEGTGLAKIVTIPAARDSRFGANPLRSNVFAANFYNPGDHKRGMPLPLQSHGNGPAPQDTYTWECLNRNEDVRARIRIMIREWNSQIEENGDPDLSGQDPVFGDQINDRFDWLDFGDTFPGARL